MLHISIIICTVFVWDLRVPLASSERVDGTSGIKLGVDAAMPSPHTCDLAVPGSAANRSILGRWVLLTSMQGSK